MPTVYHRIPPQRLVVVLSFAALSLVACGGAQVSHDMPAPAAAAPAEAPLAPEVRRVARSLPRTPIEPAGSVEDIPAGRQLPPGYWLGAMIEPEHAEVLRALGVRVVLSAVAPSDETVEALAAADLEYVRIPLGSSFRHAETITRVAESYAPAEIFVHCRHGADRTGAIAAYLLVTRHGWSVADALYSMVYPSERDIEGLGDVLVAHGELEPVHLRQQGDEGVGRYSLSGAGVGTGGMKVRNERYARLVETVIEAMHAHDEVAAR